MARSRGKGTLTALLVAVLISGALAVTVVETEVECPVCHTRNTFMDYASWGSYVYHYPSRFQLVFFPYTWSVTLYSCKKCHLTLFMWDFRKFPKEKTAEIESALREVHFSKESGKYTDIPMSEKLAAAERLYKVLGRDQGFWLQFYRVEGFHMGCEKHAEEAVQARTRALAIAQEMLGKPEEEGHRKELLVIAAAMHHFLGDDTKAQADLDSASQLTFSEEKLDDKGKGYNEYLDQLITDYRKGIEEKNVPDGCEGG